MSTTICKSNLALFTIALTLISPLPAYAEDDPSDTCTTAASLFKEGDIEGALEEARWCVTQLEQLKQGEISTFFEDDINGFKGGKLEQQEAMGFSIVERSYSKDGKIISVSLSGGTSGAASNAFSALASFGMSAGGGKKVRIQRRTASLNTDEGNNQLAVTMKSGGLLNFESRDVSAEEIIAFAKVFPVADLDDALK
jgi:hypothetical protein